MSRTTGKNSAIAASARGPPTLAHSFILIFSLPAEIMFGMFPGINVAPDMSKAMSVPVI